MSIPHRDQQTALYGMPLGERFGAVRDAYGLSQRALADVLGLSAPMLSQLASGQRIKIGNPAVLARLLQLEERVDEPDRAAVVAQVRGSDPVLTTQPTATDVSRDALVSALAAAADTAALTAAASAAREAGSPVLAGLLREAAAR